LAVFATGTFVSAEEVYLTATGEQVGVLDVFQDCDGCPEMIVLPLGQFQMGSSQEEVAQARRRYYANRNIDPDKDPQRSINPFPNERPAHQVLIDLPIAMGRNEVTREEWAACVEDGGCEQGLYDISPSAWIGCLNASDCTLTPDDRIRFRLQYNPHPTHPRNPREGVTYHEMRDYTTWLNDRIGADVYRLPTEAEWEYAARAGTTTTFAQGDTLTLGQANFSVSRRDVVNDEYVWKYDLGSPRELVPVDSLNAANDWGLRHMSGNVSEFTSTCGSGPHRGLGSSSQYLAVDADRLTCRRSLKGGMYYGNVELARPARRVAIDDNHWSPSIGFRIVRDLEPDFDAAN